LSPCHLGIELLAFVEVRVDQAMPQVFEKFRVAIEPVEEIVECHMVAGTETFDYMMKIRVADMNAYRQILNKQLLTIPGVIHTRTYVVIQEIKSKVNFKF
jgi:Lrp/AsnC family leucine-responsive transcriptional regulator